MPLPQSPSTSEFHSDLMTAKETSEYLHIPVPTVYHLMHHGKLPAVHIGGRWRIKRSLLDRDVLRKDEDSSSSQPSVLVVDNDPDMCVLFMQFLRKANLARLVVGSGGASAIAMAKKQMFDLVFLELNLPDIPGDEVYVQLKALNPDMSIAVITGYPDSEILSRILACG